MARKQHTKPSSRRGINIVVAAALVSTIPMASAQSCVSLAGSTQCSAFNTSSISTSRQLVDYFPFLGFVSSREDFDRQLSTYVQQDFVRQKYQLDLGCSDINLMNASNYYARYTTSVVCNAIVQNSIGPCRLSTNDSKPLCADSCALQATSEEEIAMNSQLCGTPGNNFLAKIRADFTECALPADSLSGNCISAESNEPDECGFSSNLQGLCGYCGASSPNATDSCCQGSNVTQRCSGVTLPTLSSMPPFMPSSTSASTQSGAASSTAAPAASGNHGLSGGAIAGIVIGSILGAALLLGLLAFLCVLLRRRRRRDSQKGSVFNQPSPKRATQPAMGYAPPQDLPAPGGRVARMTALEGESSDDKGQPNPVLAAERRGYNDTSESDPYAESPTRGGPVTGRRQGSLSSNSALNALDDTSPSNNQYSSPGDVNSGQSEQLPFFKDYYSQDEIHPGDKVAVLWAYQPRAADEFELERGDMLRVVGIWDDGWATGVRIDDRAEDYDGKHKVQRDSGVSNGTGRRESPTPQGEVKAFPLVCVCLPEHWKKTIEQDSSTETTSPSNYGPQSFSNF